MPVHKSITDARTLADLFRARVALTPDAVAYRQYDARSGEWLGWTWRRTGEAVDRWRAALAGERFPIGSRVATLIGNSVGYVCVDQAALSLGHVIVPMHLTDNPGNLAYILQDSGVAALIIDNPACWARLAPAVAGRSGLKRVVVVADDGVGEDGPIEGDARAVRASPWLRAAEAHEGLAPAVSPDMLAAIVYTSGTTGRPKSVMLSHRNVISNVLAVLQYVTASPDDIFLSFLPLSHTFERTAGYYLPIAAGSVVAFGRSTALLSEDMRTISPTILISVPRIYERVYLHIQETVARRGALARWLFSLAEHVGWDRHVGSQSFPPRQLSLSRRASWLVLDSLVAAKVRAPNSAVGCVLRSQVVRLCRKLSRAASWPWASICFRAMA